MKKLSPRMIELLRNLSPGGTNDTVHWMGGLNAHAFRAGRTMQSVTTTVQALRERGLVRVAFNSGSLKNGTVEITKEGIAYLGAKP